MIFSVIVTGRNTMPFLKDCLDSVVAQTDRDFECLIGDDASDDNSAQAISGWIAKYGDDRFRLLAFEERLYVPTTTRRLIEAATGDIVVWIGGDDLFSGPHALARIRRTYERAGETIDATYGSFLTIPKMAAWPLRLHPQGYPWYEGWCFSHILTWRRRLSLESFAEEWDTPAYQCLEGGAYRTAGDVALYYPVVFRAKTIAYIPDVIYMYRRHEANDDRIDRKGQMAAEQRICAYWKQRVIDRDDRRLVRPVGAGETAINKAPHP